MEKEKVIIIPKRSKYELDMHFLKLNHEQLMEKYKKEGVNTEAILESHVAQKNALNELKKFFTPSQFLFRDYITKDKLKQYELVISFGGDNHFKYVSHFIEDQLYLGINSDPYRSEGVLTSMNSEKIKKFVELIEKEEFGIEEWARLKFEVNGKEGFATTEIFLGEKYRKYMSRHILEHNGKSEQQKCSGVVIATGSGSTGWYDSSIRYLHAKGNTWNKCEKRAEFVVTEPYRGKLSGSSLLQGVITKGEELVINSLNDANGLLITDAIEEYPFNRGSTARIKLHEIPLKVVVFRNI